MRANHPAGESSSANSREQFGAPQTVSMKVVSVVVLGSNEERRRNLVDLLSGFEAKVTRHGALPEQDDLAAWISHDCEVLIVDIERDQEHALKLVEVACGRDSAMTVMIYSRQEDPGLLLRAMRAGAREVLNDPLSASSVAEALVRASIRRDELLRTKKTAGRLMLFVGAKGGSGVTTVAANFAVLLAKTGGEKVALLDLNLNLGDAALTIGLNSQFSSADALRNERRLDLDFVSSMFVKHSAGLHLLAASDRLENFQPTGAAVAKLISIVRSDFDVVVIDAGCDYPDYVQSLFDLAEKTFLVTQVSVVELRNCHRIIETHFEDGAKSRLDVILNRHTSRPGEIDEPTIAKALGVNPAWKIPSDFPAVRNAQNSASALALKDGPITRALFGMVRSVCGTTTQEVKKKRFGLF